MAVAGKVAFTPVGDYDKSKAYKRLDYVRYNNATYSARKDVPVGIDITNTEYWMLNVEGGGSGGGTGIDDEKISTTTTYSSKKINTLVEEKTTEINNDIDNKLEDKIDKTDGNISETVASTADVPEIRTMPTVGDKFKAIFGKTIKYFQDLKTIAFTGDYEDLLNKPTIPTVTNNLLATNAGTALDAVQGKALNDKLGTTDISRIGDGTITNAISMLNSDIISSKNMITSSNRQTCTLTYISTDVAKWEPLCIIDSYGAISVYNPNTQKTILIGGNTSAGCSVSVTENKIKITFNSLYSFRWIYVPSLSKVISVAHE